MREGIIRVAVFAVFAVVAWTASAGAQVDAPPPEQSNLICIEADPPVIVPDSARLAAALAGLEAPKGLSVKQSQRLSHVAQAFLAGREQLALQHWGAAVSDAVQTVGARLAEQDVVDLMMTVLRQVAADEADGLRLLITQIEHVNAQKAALRDYVNKLRDQQADLEQRCPDNCDVVTQAEVHTEVARADDELDVLGDVTMEKQGRLQMYMEAYSQSFAMLTNLFAKMSDTAQRINDKIK